MACHLMELVPVEVLLLRVWKVKALRDHDAAAYSVGQHWL